MTVVEQGKEREVTKEQFEEMLKDTNIRLKKTNEEQDKFTVLKKMEG